VADLDQAGPPGATLAHCPMPACDWSQVTMPGPAEQPGALADVFGWGVFAAHAANERRQAFEQEIRAHLETHPLIEWVTALRDARERIREMEATT
jgi:hypothetical protein